MQYIGIQHGNYIRNGHDRTDMTAAGKVSHFNAVPTDQPCKIFAFHEAAPFSLAVEIPIR